jgi:uncharacterized membrane protein YbhN (UPF0104 family)
MDWADLTIPNNLCGYVRKLAMLLIVMSVITLVFSFSIAAIFSFLLYLLPWFLPNMGLVVIGGSSLAAISILSLITWWSNRPEKEEKITELGLIGSYFKAKHDKFCPRLTFTKD